MTQPCQIRCLDMSWFTNIRYRLASCCSQLWNISWEAHEGASKVLEPITRVCPCFSEWKYAGKILGLCILPDFTSKLLWRRCRNQHVNMSSCFRKSNYQPPMNGGPFFTDTKKWHRYNEVWGVVVDSAPKDPEDLARVSGKAQSFHQKMKGREAREPL